jgi:ComF family protein
VSSYPLDEHDLCTFCREGQVTFDATYSFGSYEGALRKVIHLFKYSRVQTLAEPLGALLVTALPLEARFDVILPMPMHWFKRWQRGFNQAELLAQVVARRYGLRVSQNLQRSRRTKAQASLTEAERRTNLQGSFLVKRPEELWGKRILLVDDVMTTGATLREAAATLKKAGPRSVTALTLARVDRPGDDLHLRSLQALNQAVDRERAGSPEPDLARPPVPEQVSREP